MPQRYKLRLGDGTFMAVDLEGLKAWVGDRRAVVQTVGSQQWRPLAEVLTEEESAARLMRALIRPDSQPVRPSAPPTPPPPPPPPPPSAPASFEPPPPATFEPSTLLPEPAPLPPAWEPPAAGPPAFSEPAAFGEPAGFGESAFGQPTRFDEPSPFEGSPIGDHTGVQALADEPANAATAALGQEMPVIRMKAVDDEPEFKSAWAEDAEPERDDAEERPRNDRLEGPLLTLLETVGGFLSRVLAPLAPRLRDVQFRSEREAEPRRSTGASPSGVRKTAVSAQAPARVIALADDVGPSLTTRAESSGEAALDADRGPSLFARVAQWARGLRDRARPEPATEAPEPVVAPPPRPAAPPLIPREPVQAPPTPVSELPVLRFVERPEPRRVEQVYDEGDDDGPTWSISLEPVWRWTKRIVVLGALAAGGAYAVLERDTWFPKAADVGQSVFTEVDRQVLSHKRDEQQRAALAAAQERLPGLAPETILLVFARNPSGIEEAPEVFQVAREAAERGRGALAPADAEELRRLERDVLASLSNTERARVREYDATRTRRVIFPFENPHVMDLVARGVRSLPPDRLARLQRLTHEAVVAGIDETPR